MKTLFSGKKKLITIPLAVIIGLAFFPFAIGGLLLWLTGKKVTNNKLKYGLMAAILLPTLFVGSAWVAGMSSSSTPVEKQEQSGQQAQQVSNSPQPTQQEASSTPTLKPTDTTADRKFVSAKVIKVVDGDTMQVSLNGKTETVRVIGIDTPEIVDPRKTVQCFGKEASNMAKEQLQNQTVQLESDPSQDDRDKYQRLLRYVWLDDGSNDFGKIMIQFGYAHEYTYNVPYKYQAEYKKAQTDARNGKKGLWSDTTCAGNTTSQVVSTPKPTTKPVMQQQPTTNTQPQTNTQNNTGGRSCSGVDYDCSDFSSHSEAQSFFNSCGFTAENDPMKLDSVGVGDGIACESL